MQDAPAPPEPAVQRLRLDLAYDGGAFAGWARQPGERTVQGVIEDALALIAGADDGPPRLTVAGRTDAGVHAEGQVAHVDLTTAQASRLMATRSGSGGPARLVTRVNGVLSRHPDVVLRGARPAPDGFDARFSATDRRYRYRVADGAAFHDPVQRARTLHLARVLDADAMTAAARTVVGLHDFAAFCKPRPGATTIRSLQRFEWARDVDGVLVAELVADAFCHSMVRALVGASIAVGQGRLEEDGPRRLLDGRRRAPGFAVAPPHGLTLVSVGYPPDEELASRAAGTRALRRLSDLPGVGYS